MMPLTHIKIQLIYTVAPLCAMQTSLPRFGQVGNVLFVECLILSVFCATGGLTFDDLLWLCAKWRQGSAAVVVIITRCSEIMHAL